MDLSLATCEELLQELTTRYTALVVTGTHREDVDEITQVVVGPAYMCLGLLNQMSLGLTASLNHPLDEL